MKEDIRAKLFSYGLYGRPTTELDKEDISAVLKVPYTEIVPETVVANLKTKFTLRSLEPDYKGCSTLPEGCVVRMQTQAWREYIFGQRVNITSKEYFYLIDFLLNRDDYVASAEVRSTLRIDSKTYFYICKKLKELEIISEVKEGHLSSIKLNPIVDRSAKVKVSSFEEELFRQTEDLDPGKIELLANVPFVEHIRLIVRRSPSGLDTKTLRQITGVRLKTGLKLMQRIAAQEETEFCLATEMCYRSSICKLYTCSAYESITKARMARVSGKSTAGELNTISAEEKVAAMRFLAEKYGSFVLGKDILKQLLELTGWAYSFDRKTLLNSAKAAGLHITKSVIGRYKRYTISIEPLDQLDDKAKHTLAKQTKDNERFKRRMKYKILLNSTQVRLDNGAAQNIWTAYRELLKCFSEYFSKPGISLISLVSRLPTGVFLGVSNFTRPCLLYKAAYNAWKSNREYFSGLNHGLENSSSIFNIKHNMELVKPGVLDIACHLASVPTGDFINVLPERLASIFRRKMEGKGIRTALRKLKNEGFIEIINNNGLLHLKKGRIDIEDIKMTRLISDTRKKFYVAYNTRELIYRKLCQIGPDLSDSDQEAYIRKNFLGDVADALCTPTSTFTSMDRDKGRAPLRKTTTLPENLRGLYLKIKSALVKIYFYNTSESLTFFEKTDDICSVLGYLVYKRIVSSRCMPVDILSVPLNRKFTRMFGENLYFYKEFLYEEESYCFLYFNRIHNLVSSCGSIDTRAILERLVYIEDFELDKFFQVFGSVFRLQRLGEFTFVSLADVPDPFMIG
ncbi:hypothetical protein PAEPH01_0579 [Pancytospora epiphaga]|nr:hypothetical protein PAEPH01_0579 [Pancytospora epiphaga]